MEQPFAGIVCHECYLGRLIWPDQKRIPPWFALIDIRSGSVENLEMMTMDMHGMNPGGPVYGFNKNGFALPGLEKRFLGEIGHSVKGPGLSCGAEIISLKLFSLVDDVNHASHRTACHLQADASGLGEVS